MFDFDICRTFDFLTVRNKCSIIQERSGTGIFTTSGLLKRNGTPVLTPSGVRKSVFTALMINYITRIKNGLKAILSRSMLIRCSRSIMTFDGVRRIVTAFKLLKV